MGLVILGGLVFAVIVGVIVFFLVLDSLTPGTSNETVTDGDQAITKVNATSVTIFGLISLAAYKVFGKKTEQAPKKAATVTDV